MSDSADPSQRSDAPPAWLPRALRLAERLHRSLANGDSDDDLNDAATLCQVLLDAFDSSRSSSALLAGQRDGERLVLPVAQLNHALGWLAGGEMGEMADDALVKITDAKGYAICTLTAEWLRALTELPQPKRVDPTWEPDDDLISPSAGASDDGQ